jgi:hypothetical protein
MMHPQKFRPFTKKYWSLIIIAGVMLWLGACDKSQPERVISDEETVVALTETFGSRLQQVSLLDAPEAVISQMQAHYGDLVSEDLLAEWSNDPVNAPGRLTSSPWPDRIEVETIEKMGDVFGVQGTLMEVTSSEGPGGEPIAKRPVNLIFEKIDRQWKMTGLTMGDYESPSPGDPGSQTVLGLPFYLILDSAILPLNGWDTEIDYTSILGEPEYEYIEVAGPNADTFNGSFLKEVAYEDLNMAWFSPKDNGKTFWLMRMTVTGDRLKTPEGIQVGSTLEELQEAYQGRMALVLDGRTDPDNCAYRLSKRDQYQYLQFEVKNGIVTEILLYVELP